MERVKGIEPSSQTWKAHLDKAELPRGRRGPVSGWVDRETGVYHMGICKYPIVVLKGSGQSAMRRVLAEARLAPGVAVADFPREMLDTYTDEEMVAAVSQRRESELEYLAIAILAPGDELKHLTKELKLWR